MSLSNTSSFHAGVPPAAITPPPLPPERIAEMLQFSWWPISCVGDYEDRKYRTLERKGWRGLCLSGESPFEKKVIDAWARQAPKGEVLRTRIYMCSERLGHYGVFESPSRCIWVAPQHFDAVEAMLKSIPIRPHAFIVGDMPHEDFYRRLRGINHRFYQVESQDHFAWRARGCFDTRFVSVQDCDHVALLKLFSAL